MRRMDPLVRLMLPGLLLVATTMLAETVDTTGGHPYHYTHSANRTEQAPNARREHAFRLPWSLWAADSMTNVLRTSAAASDATAARISLARNEFEGIQIVVAAGGAGASGLRWSVASPAPLEAELRPIGYVHAGLSAGCPWNVTANPRCTHKTPIDCGDGACRSRAKFACTGCSEMGPMSPTSVRW